MPKKRSKRRSKKLSLYPLSLEEALKKFLTTPFVPPKKQKRRK